MCSLRLLSSSEGWIVFLGGGWVGERVVLLHLNNRKKCISCSVGSRSSELTIYTTQ